jgi:hypothetical protein
MEKPCCSDPCSVVGCQGGGHCHASRRKSQVAVAEVLQTCPSLVPDPRQTRTVVRGGICEQGRENRGHGHVVGARPQLAQTRHGGIHRLWAAGWGVSLALLDLDQRRPQGRYRGGGGRPCRIGGIPRLAKQVGDGDLQRRRDGGQGRSLVDGPTTSLHLGDV